MILKTFGSNLKFLREQKGCTQKQVADILCVTDKTYSNWELGRHWPNEQLLVELCKFYNYTNLYKLLVVDIKQQYLQLN